jgi:hypothetical protein
MNSRTPGLAACLVLTFAARALANPVYVDPSPMVFSALIIEVAVLVILLAPRGYDVLVIGFCWLGITIASWVVLGVGCYALAAGLEKALPTTRVPPIAVLCAGEVAIIHLEALVLSLLTSLRSVRKRSEAPLSLSAALVISAVINVASILAGFIGLVAVS